MIGSATALGILVGHSQVASMTAVMAVAFSTALYASASRAAGTISAQTTAILCVIIGLRLPTSGAFQNGLLVCSGSAVQLFLLTLVWPMKPGMPERRAVAGAYEGLAQFVLSLKDKTSAEEPLIPNAVSIEDARSLLSEAESYHRHSEHEHLIEALRRSESIRAALVGFAQANMAFASVDRLSRVRSHRILRSVARCLRTIGNSAVQGTLSTNPVTLKITNFESKSEEAKEYKRWLGMLGELVQDCCSGSSVTRYSAPAKNVKLTHTWSLFTALTKVPDIGSLRSVTLRHAIRYAFTVEIAFAISLHWTRSHSYWLPVTVAIALRQDYGTTLQRGISRLVGTLVGLLVAMAVMDLLHPSTLILQILAVAMTWFAFATVQAGYVVMTIAITGYVVYSIALSGAAAGEVSSMRLVASMFGVSLAVASYVLWPAWRWPHVWETLKTAADAQASYLRLILFDHETHGPSDPCASPDTTLVERALIETRALRIQSEHLVAAAKVHPLGRRRDLIRRAEDVLLALEINAAQILVAQTEWNMGLLGSEERLRMVLKQAEALKWSVAGPRGPEY